MEIRQLLLLLIMPLTVACVLELLAFARSERWRGRWIMNLYGAAGRAAETADGRSLVKIKARWHYVSGLVLLGLFVLSAVLITLLVDSFSLGLVASFVGLVGLYPIWMAESERLFNRKILGIHPRIASLQPRRWRDYISPWREIIVLAALFGLIAVTGLRLGNLPQVFSFVFLPRWKSAFTLPGTPWTAFLLPVCGAALYALTAVGMNQIVRARRFLDTTHPSFSEVADNNFRRLRLLESWWLRLYGIGLVALSQVSLLWPELPTEAIVAASVFMALVIAGGTVEIAVQGRCQ